MYINEGACHGYFVHFARATTDIFGVWITEVRITDFLV